MANSEISKGVFPIDISPIIDNGYNFPFTQEDLSYSFDALEPHIDTATMQVHYNGHHKAYTNNFNKAIEDSNINVGERHLIRILTNVSKYDDPVKNNGGGYFNHLIFWRMLTPNGIGAPLGDSSVAISAKFGSFDNFKKAFGDAAATRFGSGWAWLSVGLDGELFISSTANQNNPIMDVVEPKGLPILTLDVWEHAYYLKHQNKRNEYINSFWNVVNWEEVEIRYQEAKGIIGK
jgi:Fe-Mn family superoxide dismutase